MRFSLTAALVGVVTLVSTVFSDLHNRLNMKDSVVLFIDHQTGLFNLVRDYDPDYYLNQVMAVAEMTKYFNLPAILTTSREDGAQWSPSSRYQEHINAWDDEDFVKAVESTGKKKSIISGTVTGVCTSFVSLSEKRAGFEIFFITNASGTFNKPVRLASWLRMQQADIQLMNPFSVACELARDWRTDLEGLANMFAKRIPSYTRVMDSYNGAQAALKSS